MDNLVAAGKIPNDVVAQIGAGKYKPRKIESFRLSPSLEEYYNKADLVISNCGAGTIMENVTKGRKLIVIQNPDITGGHEWELVTEMEQGHHLIWCKNIEQLQQSIEQASTFQFETFKPQRLDIVAVIEKLVKDIS